MRWQNNASRWRVHYKEITLIWCDVSNSPYIYAQIENIYNGMFFAEGMLVVFFFF